MGKKLFIIFGNAVMLIVAIIALIAGLDQTCILVCGFSLAITCMQGMLEWKPKGAPILIAILGCAAVAGLFIYPLILCIVAFIMLLSLSTYELIIKKSRKAQHK